MDLKERYKNLCARYNPAEVLVKSQWDRIEKAYSGPSRHYHDLSHLQNMFKYADECVALFSDFETVSFSIFYHDIVYSATSKQNEAKSAEEAVKAMQQLGVSFPAIQKCDLQIRATKAHELSQDEDLNLLLDIDLSVLGADWETYKRYTENVRKEYRIFPDFLYKPGRKKVLKHFLAMQQIYKTDFFRDKFEEQATANMKRELQQLLS